MAQFRGTLQGQRGEASRLGSIVSGLTAEVNGWDSGVTVRAYVLDGNDVFYIYSNGGSNQKYKGFCIGFIDHKGQFHPESVI